MKLLRSDVILPRDLGRRSGPAFIVIRDPGKAKRRGVRAQQVTIDDPDTVEFLTWALEGLARAAPIWPSTPATFARRWSLYFGSVLGLSVAAADGFTPASMRAGCATELYQATRDLVLLLSNHIIIDGGLHDHRTNEWVCVNFKRPRSLETGFGHPGRWSDIQEHTKIKCKESS